MPKEVKCDRCGTMCLDYRTGPQRSCILCGSRDARRAEHELRQLRDLVRKTRAAQNKYFRTRTQADLREARALETRLDSLIAPQPSLPGIGGAP